MRAAYDARFRDAVYAARDGQPGALVEWLRSDTPLGVGERDLLAALVAGALNRRAGAPGGGKVKPAVMRAACVEYLQRRENGEAAKKSKGEICERLGIGTSTFDSRLQEWKATVKRLDAMGLDGLSIMASK